MFDTIAISDTWFPVSQRSDAKLINQKLLILSWGYLLTGAWGWYFGYWTFFDVPIVPVDFVNL